MTADQTRRGNTLPAARQRIARIPGPRALGHFAHHLQRPLRSSTLRGLFDGGYVAWTLRKRGLRTLISAAGANEGVPDAERSRRVAGAVDAGLRMIPMAQTCLRRSVTLVRELHRLGLACALHIGVRFAGDRVEAHAWVQVGDTVVNDDPFETATYTELAAGQVESILRLLR